MTGVEELRREGGGGGGGGGGAAAEPADGVMLTEFIPVMTDSIFGVAWEDPFVGLFMAGSGGGGGGGGV